MRHSDIRKYCPLDRASETILLRAVERFSFSMRTFERLLKVGRTIADLESADRISRRHIAEAIQYRVLDRFQLPSFA
jgi:magnesium chelatase family protein